MSTKKSMPVWNLYAERIEADYVLTTYKYLRIPPPRSFFTSNSYFDGTSGRYSPDFPTSGDTQCGSDVLTAETPRLGGDLYGSPQSPLLALIHALYRCWEEWGHHALLQWLTMAHNSA